MRFSFFSGKLHIQDVQELVKLLRALLGSRFKILLADTGLSPEEAGKLLHVTPRTIRYWLSGKVMVPYAAYKLVRVMRLFELPCEGWDGWHMHSGRLWSPEGHGFTPHDSNWWGLLVRKARSFHQLYDRDRQLDILMQRLGAGRQPAAGQEDALAHLWPMAAGVPTGEAGRAAQPTGLDLSNKHFGTYKTEKRPDTEPAAIESVATVHNVKSEGVQP